jgi:formylmethanofuran dehydrogenase subunit E
MRERQRAYKVGSYLKSCDRCGMLRYIEDLRRQYGKDYCPECLDVEDEYPQNNK